MFEYQDQLNAFILSHGYTITTPIEFDGTWHEVKSTDGTKLRYIGVKNTKGNYRLTFGAFSWGDRFETWHSHKGVELKTPEEKHQAKQEKIAKEESLAKTAQLIFEEECSNVSLGATYLSRKWPLGTLPLPSFKHNWKKDINHSYMLMVPMEDMSGKIWNVQSIQADGSKRNLQGKKSGLHLPVFPHDLQVSTDHLFICEGLSTSMTVATAMGAAVFCAFGIDNIPNILEDIRKTRKDLSVVVVVDNDWEKKENAGALMKEKLLKKYQGIKVVMPSSYLMNPGLTDYNDVLMCDRDSYTTLNMIKTDIELQIKDSAPPPEPPPIDQEKVDEILTEATKKLEPDYTGEIKLHDPMHTPKIQTKHDKNGVFVGDIKSFDSGFHTEVLKGNSVIKVPDYSGLRLYFERIYHYKILGESKECFIWNGTHYEFMSDVYIENFAQKHLFPTAKNNMVNEFKNLVLRTNVYPIEFFTHKTQRKINFKNGYFEIESQSFNNSIKEIGFRYSLPFDYDPLATCPQFDSFMERVTCGDKELEQLLLEYCGYAISGDAPWAQKCMVLVGEGANGKSTFVNTIRAVFGERNTAAVSATKFSDGNALSLMDGKLMNIAEETPKKAFMESDVFKNLVTGGMVAAKKLYKNLYEVRMTTKLMMLCNDLPSSFDSSFGFYRRLMIAPFKATFKENSEGFDPHIEAKLLKELPGIANRVLRAYETMAKRGKFIIPESSRRELEQYKKDNDHVELWKDESIEVHPLGNGHDNTWASMKDLYGSYADYCRENGYKNLNNNYFGKQLRRLVDNYPERNGRFGPKHDRKRGLKGVTRYNGVPFHKEGETSQKMHVSTENRPENRESSSELF